MKTAVITGASAGLGREFISLIPEFYPDIEEYWLISRREDKLRAAAESAKRPCRIFPLDLSKDASYEVLAGALTESKADVKLLVNNSGCGFLGNVGELDSQRQTAMTDVNVRGLTAVTEVVVPHMTEGAAIINISSIASFCPNPRMSTYSATKAYVTAFSLGIGEELKPKKITSTAVCPGPMDTEFIKLGAIKGNSRTFETLPYCIPSKVARGAMKAAKRGRSVYTPRVFYKFYRALAKILPVKLMIKFAKT